MRYAAYTLDACPLLSLLLLQEKSLLCPPTGRLLIALVLAIMLKIALVILFILTMAVSRIPSRLTPRRSSMIVSGPSMIVSGPLAQSAERGADNAKVVSSTLTRTKEKFFFYLNFFLRNHIL